ncbi:MAG: GGDEF domain-containing protein [Rhodospirillales bacterium]|nr:GGDEF domain-containing protein [Rhodospirillales bacterium]
MELILTEAEFLKKQVREQTDRIIYLEQLATTDELTGIANRRGFELELNRTLARASRQNEEGVLVYVDLDDFKPVNDTYGHAAGDEVLCRAAAVLLENTRDMDTVGRLGGDEFAIVLVGTNRDDGLARAETLNRALNRSSITWQGHNIPIRASFGMQAYRAGDAAADLMTNADAAMYSIKEMKASSATGGRRANRQASPLVAQTAV